MINAARLTIAPEYAVHVIDADDVVILYNQKRPLLLKGHDMVRLFEYLESRPSQLITAEDLMALPEDLILLAAQLLKENILTYIDPAQSNDYTTGINLT